MVFVLDPGGLIPVIASYGETDIQNTMSLPYITRSCALDDENKGQKDYKYISCGRGSDDQEGATFGIGDKGRWIGVIGQKQSVVEKPPASQISISRSLVVRNYDTTIWNAMRVVSVAMSGGNSRWDLIRKAFPKATSAAQQLYINQNIPLSSYTLASTVPTFTDSRSVPSFSQLVDYYLQSSSPPLVFAEMCAALSTRCSMFMNSFDSYDIVVGDRKQSYLYKYIPSDSEVDDIDSAEVQHVIYSLTAGVYFLKDGCLSSGVGVPESRIVQKAKCLFDDDKIPISNLLDSVLETTADSCRYASVFAIVKNKINDDQSIEFLHTFSQSDVVSLKSVSISLSIRQDADKLVDPPPKERKRRNHGSRAVNTRLVRRPLSSSRNQSSSPMGISHIKTNVVEVPEGGVHSPLSRNGKT